ncbi:mucin-2-like [Malaya genurostris]|uniref:mucin-2-like n=1 Tax=Malaya genurostris TaxID=325434 RepID=UPI0026F407DB|nr:mucin-2-like [Malaya genurostris]
MAIIVNVLIMARSRYLQAKYKHCYRKRKKQKTPTEHISVSRPRTTETIETDIPTTIAADELMPIDIATSTIDIGTVPPSPPLTATTNICNTSTAPCPPLTSSTLPPVLPTTRSNRPNFLPPPTATMTPVITANQHQSTTTAIIVTTTNYIQPAGTTNTTASFGNACTSTASRPFIPIHGDNGSNDIGYTARNNQTTPILQHIIPAQSNLNVTPANTAQVPMKISKQPKVSVLSNIPYVGPIQFKLTPNSNNQINNNLAPPPLPTRNTSSLANRQITALQVALPTRPIMKTIETDIPTTIAADELMPIDIATSTIDIGTVPPSPPLTATTNICNTSTAPCPPLTSSTLLPVLPTTRSNRPNFLPPPTATMTPVITANQHQSTTTAIIVTTTNYIQPAGTTNTTASFGNACTSTASRPFIPIHGDNGSNDIGYTARNNQTTPILQHIIPAQSNLNVTPANTAQVPMKISKQPKVSVLSNIPYVGPIQFKLTPNSNNQINNNLAPPPLPTRNTSSLANRQITALQVALPTRPIMKTIETDIPTTIAADELMPIDIATSTIDIGTVPPSPPLTATTNICNTSTAPCPPLTSSTLPPVLPTTRSNRPNFLPPPTATMTPVITANQHQPTTTAIIVTTTNYIQPAGTTNTTASFGNACTSTASRPFIPIHGDNGSNDIGYTARNNQTTPILQHIIPAQSNLNVTPANTAQVPMKISKQPKVSVLSNIPYVGPIQFKLTPNSNNQINNNLAPPPLPTRNTSSLANRQITALQVALPTRPIMKTYKGSFQMNGFAHHYIKPYNGPVKFWPVFQAVTAEQKCYSD